MRETAQRCEDVGISDCFLEKNGPPFQDGRAARLFGVPRGRALRTRWPIRTGR